MYSWRLRGGSAVTTATVEIKRTSMRPAYGLGLGRQRLALPHAAVGHHVAVLAAPLHLAALELLVIERRVQPALPEQVPVRPRLHHLPAVDDVDHVGVDD